MYLSQESFHLLRLDKNKTMKKRSGSLLILLLIISSQLLVAQQFPNSLRIPDTISGTTFNLEVAPSKMQFMPGDSTNTFGINGPYLGPTLIMNAGDFVQMNVTNFLGETTTMHWHGMHVAPEDDGGPHTPILDGETWSPDFTVLEEATTFWYHPHLHHNTARQVYNGAAGMILIRDDNPVAAQLPHHYGIDEFPLIIQDKSFDTTNQFIFTELSDTMMVNGSLGAHLEVPAQMVRFHLLNASNQRAYNLGFPPGIDMWQIGSDGGLLENPLSMNRVQITPGERAEILVDFSGIPISTVHLISFATEMGAGLSGGPNGPRGRIGNPLDSADFEVMEFRIVQQTADPVTSLPQGSLNAYSIPLRSEADRFRKKTFTVDSTGFPFYINGTIMDMDVINDTVRLGDTEVWTLVNATDVAHPWHIHDIQFHILDINGNQPPPHLRGRKDVIIVQPFDSISYITTFDDFANDSIPYMFHCHNLFHEDGGMMGQFIVVNTTAIEEPKLSKQLEYELFPNPTNGIFQIRSKNDVPDMQRIEVLSIEGKLLDTFNPQMANRSLELDLTDYSAGHYIVRLIHKNGQTSALKLQKVN